MDNATNDNLDPRDYNLDPHDLDEWLEFPEDDENSKQNRRGKKRRRPLRKNRKPSRPANYIGQRTNNHLLRICPGNKPIDFMQEN